jgi:hypothetical protein
MAPKFGVWRFFLTSHLLISKRFWATLSQVTKAADKMTITLKDRYYRDRTYSDLSVKDALNLRMSEASLATDDAEHISRQREEILLEVLSNVIERLDIQGQELVELLGLQHGHELVDEPKSLSIGIGPAGTSL